MAVLHTDSWFALQVAPKMEMRVVTALQGKNYEMLLPTYKERRNWSDRIKLVEVPLFPGYVFCRLAERCIGRAIATPGVRKIVGFGGKPYPLEGHEITAIQKIIESEVAAMPWPFVRVGERVRIGEGPLAGVIGVVTRVKNQERLIVSVEMLMRSVAVDIDALALTRTDAVGSMN